MYHSNSIIYTCLSLIVLSLSTAVLAESNNPPSQQPSSNSTGFKESAAETKLRLGHGDPVAGKAKAGMCTSCHGEDGNSADSKTPKLAGQYGLYIEKQVHNYQTGLLSHQLMGTMAAMVSDADLPDIAAYFASQPMMKGERPSNNAIGKNLFENNDLPRMMVRCKNCHGDTGRGLHPGNPIFPVIGGQHKEFLLKQLLQFKEGVRNNSPGGVMNTTVHRLTDAELEALADYTSGL